MKQVYFYDEGDGKNKKLLGGKGAGLCEMTKLKLPVPPGFTITTEVCKMYYTNNKKLPKTLIPEVKKNIAKIEKRTGKKWNSKENPLLVSVRSGAAISMPGMMDTILNLGLNDETVEGLAKKSSNPRFAWDSYRRFVQLFGKVVFGVEDKKFDEILEDAKRNQAVQADSALNEKSLKIVVSEYKKICEKHTGVKFPSDPSEQLELAIKAVFGSWMGERAIVYREKNRITKDIADGTAMSFVMLFFSLYTTALSPIQLPNTALIANSSCSDGSEGNFTPVCFSQIFLYSETTVFRDFSFNALSACTAWFSFAFSNTSSNFLSSTPNTTLPNS